MNRNVNDYFTHTPTPHFPRNRFDMGMHKKLMTIGHGRLYPFYCRAVYPGDTWSDSPVPFIRADTSLRVPLDDIYLDTYFFFVPFRIIDDNFKKILGDKDPYDDNTYSIPQIHLTYGTMVESAKSYLHVYSPDCLLSYLGYYQADAHQDSETGKYSLCYDDDICAYPLAAYYKIYNDWFRDENLDATFDYASLYGKTAEENTIIEDPFSFFDALYVNKYHDYFTSGTIAPQKGPAVTIPLGTSAPVGFIPSATVASTSAAQNVQLVTGASLTQGTFYNLGLNGTTVTGATGEKVIADLSKAAGTINELRLSFAIQSLYERRNRFGTRYVETIRGQWGIEVPDSFFQRPEYLGGSRVTLNNVPVLSTENSSQLGQMSGNSATLGGQNSFTKSFIEYGLIIGLCCTRVHHSYGQGKKKEIWSLKTDLDLYNPVFANIGFQPTMTNELYNQGDEDSSVFNYQEAWSELRMDMDEFKGLFGIFSGVTELKNKWHYGDYYASKPVFSDTWLKESVVNVSRTMTGQLIPGAGNTDPDDIRWKHQFMVAYYCHPKVTRILPSHSIPVELIGRL